MIEHCVIAFVVALFATVLSLMPLFNYRDLGGWAQFLSALPLWGTAIAQAYVVDRGRWREPEVIPALMMLLALVPLTTLGTFELGASDATVIIVGSASTLIVLAGFCAVGGLVLRELPAMSHGLAVLLTGAAFLMAGVLPSIPENMYPWRNPPPSYLLSLPVAGILPVDGPPVTAHGVTYRNIHDEYGGGLCTITMTFRDEASSTSLPCRLRTLRCDDRRRWCMVEDAQYPAGYTYAFARTGLVDQALYDHQRRKGDTALRVCAELLALAAALLLFRGRESPDRPIFAASAITAATMGIALVVRILL